MPLRDEDRGFGGSFRLQFEEDRGVVVFGHDLLHLEPHRYLQQPRECRDVLVGTVIRHEQTDE